VQLLQLPLSTRQANVEPDSLAVNANVGVASLVVPPGLELIVVFGAVVSAGVVSTVNVDVAGLASVLPAPSVARTENVWLPSASVLAVYGLVQLVQLPLSIRHANVEPDSVEVNAKAGVASLVVPLGLELMLVSGGVVSAGGGVTGVDDPPSMRAPMLAPSLAAPIPLLPAARAKPV
jgi:hypothetical protein